MQYPLIELFYMAYKTNISWNGINLLSSSKLNLLDHTALILNTYIDDTTGQLTSYNNWASSDYIKIIPYRNYRVINISRSGGVLQSGVYWALYNINKKYIKGGIGASIDSNNDNAYYIRISQTTLIMNNSVFCDNSNQPYFINLEMIKNDFKQRLKLPKLKYFPHPVIDALERAATGTQTADDTEMLRHYLTPLGIGGI